MSSAYSKWDVCIADVRYEDTPESKVRPVLILEHHDSHVLAVKMTGHAPRPGEYALSDWSKAGLRKPTTVRVSKILSLPHSSIIKKLGHLSVLDIAGLQKFF